MTTATTTRRRATLFASPAEEAGLAAVLEAATAQPVLAVEEALPDGYTITITGGVAHLYLPTGGVAAFDGREVVNGRATRPDASRATRAAVEAARSHAAYRTHPPVIGRRGIIKESVQ